MRRRAALLGIAGILLGSGKAATAGEWSPEYRAALASTARKRKEASRRRRLSAARLRASILANRQRKAERMDEEAERRGKGD